MKKLKGYGKFKKVCYKHRSIIGAAVCSFGNCQNCKTKVSSACGGLPQLCPKCSVELSECAYCREQLE